MTDRLAFLQLNLGSLPAIQEVGGISVRRIAMSNPQPPGLESTFWSSIAFCDSQDECAGKKGIFDTCMPARLQLSFSPLAGQPSSLFEEAIYSINVFAFFVS